MLHTAKMYLKHSCENVFILLSTQSNKVRSLHTRCKNLGAALPLAPGWLAVLCLVFIDPNYLNVVPISRCLVLPFSRKIEIHI